MEEIYVKDYTKLSEYMIKKALNKKYIVCVLPYNEAIKLIREIMFYKEVKVEALDIAPAEYDGYDKEYYISLCEDMVMGVEKAWCNDRYVNAEGDITLVSGDASSKILSHIKSEETYVVSIEKDEYDEYFSHDADKFLEYFLIKKI